MRDAEFKKKVTDTTQNFTELQLEKEREILEVLKTEQAFNASNISLSFSKN